MLRRDPKTGKPLVLLPERAVELSDSSREILSLCDGTRLPDDIVRELRERHGDDEDIQRETHDFLEQMERLGVFA
jgi:coenzyme PQQ biosynthesis protein PqqD